MHLLQICDPPITPGGYMTGASRIVYETQQHFPKGHTTTVVTKEVFAGVQPGESAYERVAACLDEIDFDHVFITTEGRLGLLASWYCLARGLRFTTGWYAQYDAFVTSRHLPLDTALTNQYLTGFHNWAAKVIVPTRSMANLIEAHGVKNVVVWPFGVKTSLFRPPADKSFLDQYERPIWIYFGRLDPEKDVDHFLDLNLPAGTKLVVGDGSARRALEQGYAGDKTIFVGLKLNDDLVKHVGAADVFVFPSRSDTFGLVLVEALACGIKVAAYRGAIGSSDIITPDVGCLHDDLHTACMGALNLQATAEDCRHAALQYDWTVRAQDLLLQQVPAGIPISLAATQRFERRYGPQLCELEQKVVDFEDTLFGGKAHDLKPDEK